MTTQLTSAERYRQETSNTELQAEIVDVIAPSGFVFQFYKPDAFGVLFDIGELPVAATAKAVEAWQKDGIIQPESQNGFDTAKMFTAALKMRDRVLRLSYSPKIVLEDADASKDEINAADIRQDDLAFLYQWVQSGGTLSTPLNNFPGQPSTHAVAGANRKTRRAATKRSSRN